MNVRQSRILNAIIRRVDSGLAPLLSSIFAHALEKTSQRETVKGTSHGFTAGQAVYESNGSWALADRSSATTLAHGIVSEANGEEFEVTTRGIAFGLSGLTPGATYYLDTAGALTSTEPTSGIVQVVGLARSTSSLRVDIRRQSLSSLTVTGNVGLSTTSPLTAVQIKDGRESITFGRQEPDFPALGFNSQLAGNQPSTVTGARAFRVAADIRADDTSRALFFQTHANGSGLTTLATMRADGNVGIGITIPDSRLDVNGAITFRELSSDPANPDEGSAVLWMSNGTGSGDDGDIMIKITAGAVTKTITLVDFSAFKL